LLQFAHIEYLPALVLLIPAILIFIGNRRWKKKTKRKIGDEALVNILTANHSPGKYSFKFWLVFFAMALTALGAANLREPGKGENINRKGRDIVIAMDVSKSMLADDIKPSRLEKSKQFLTKLIKELPDDRIALIWFAGKAYLPMPLTADQGAAKMYIQSAGPDAVPTQGTVVGEALRLAAESFPQDSKRYKVVLLLTDGEDHDEAANARAQRLREQGILLITVGAGSTEGSPIPEPGTNEFKKDKFGQTVVSKLNETLLRQISATNGGLYGNLDNADALIKEISDVINQLEKKSMDGTDTASINWRNYFIWFLAGAILLLVLELFINEVRKA
jgi:Ca-activated chloride channel family protein